jgi:hypothetical protein
MAVLGSEFEMEREVSAHLTCNCVLINTSTPIREQVVVSVRVRRVKPSASAPNEGALRALDSPDFFAALSSLAASLT